MNGSVQTPEATSTRPAERPAEAPSSTAAPRRRRTGRLIGWGIVVLLVGVLTFLAILAGLRAPMAHGAFDPESPGPGGTRALAEVLRGQGVEVEVVRGGASEAAERLGPGTTLALPTPGGLTDDELRGLADHGGRTVVMTGSSRALETLELGSTAAWQSSGAAATYDGSCGTSSLARVGPFVPDMTFDPAPGVRGCLTVDDGSAAVLVADRDGSHLSLVDGSHVFTNERFAEDGNAAVALALLGQEDRVVWLVPGAGTAGEAGETLAEHTPEWVTPAILLLLLTGVAAALWRGRRLGPLVEETLPVTVRASETMLGRARLTAQAADAAHAASALRSGSLRRIARRLGLPSTSPAEHVVDAAAGRSPLSRSELHELLAGAPPADERGLIDLAQRLSRFEEAVAPDTLPQEGPIP